MSYVNIYPSSTPQLISQLLDTYGRTFGGDLRHPVFHIPQGDIDVLRLAWMRPLRCMLSVLVFVFSTETFLVSLGLSS